MTKLKFFLQVLLIGAAITGDFHVLCENRITYSYQQFALSGNDDKPEPLPPPPPTRVPGGNGSNG